MAPFADLEIGLHRYDTENYSVDFRFIQPDSDADTRLGQEKPILAQFPFEELRQHDLDLSEYGKLLTASLFADPALKTAFLQALVSSQTQQVSLRLRLLIGPTAPELNRLHWESLCSPEDSLPLCTNENILFSRYLSSLDWRPVRLRPQGKLSALIVIANPANLASYNLAPIDAAGESSRAQAGLGSIPAVVLPDATANCRAGLDDLIHSIRDRKPDILYLACHGVKVKDESWLFMEDKDGNTLRVSGGELAARFKELEERPRLVVLASCQSASAETGSALTALGPMLAEAGIPAVIAMQGNITMETVARFLPVFFQSLQKDGQIDRALSVARGAVRDRPDYWMPALFMRLKSGRIWYVPGFGLDRQQFEKWPALLRSIKRGQCTPILGAGLYDRLFGSLRDLARSWAETYHYPLAPHERESLPQVAQFLATNLDRFFPYDELEEYLRATIQQRYDASLPAEMKVSSVALDDLLESVGKANLQDNRQDPYEVLSQLPIPVYITTNTDNLLTVALKEAGKDPQVVLCPWNEYVEQVETIYDRDPGYFPTAERPLVYHLFGRLDVRESIVLTEDDYFDFLIGVTSNKDLIPKVVRRALTDTALLFLGFQLDEWGFRVLFRSILSGQGGGRRDQYAHIAAQINPEEGRTLEPERARRYLENYFYKGADISIYWGSTEDFIQELQTRWATRDSQQV